LSIFAILSATNARPMMSGICVHSASMVNTIGRILSECWRHVTSSSDGPDTRRE